ncbi:MAG: Hpt domain-containing protein [Arthrobacter sp.]
MRATTAPLHTLGGTGTGAKTPVVNAQATKAPLLNHAVLDKLRTDFEDYEDYEDYEDVWRVFSRNFITALPLRIDRLRVALTTGDLPDAIDALLSLKSASQQVGAERLAALTLDLEMAVREGTRDRDPSGILPWLAAEHLPRIRQCAGQTSYILEAHLNKAP